MNLWQADFGLSVLTGATSTVGLYPLETLRTRLAMGDYDSLMHAVRTITAEEGFMAFYQVSPCFLLFLSVEFASHQYKEVVGSNANTPYSDNMLLVLGVLTAAGVYSKLSL